MGRLEGREVAASEPGRNWGEAGEQQRGQEKSRTAATGVSSTRKRQETKHAEELLDELERTVPEMN